MHVDLQKLEFPNSCWDEAETAKTRSMHPSPPLTEECWQLGAKSEGENKINTIKNSLLDIGQSSSIALKDRNLGAIGERL